MVYDPAADGRSVMKGGGSEERPEARQETDGYIDRRLNKLQGLCPVVTELNKDRYGSMAG